MTRKRKDNMDVTSWEKLLATRCEPAIASSCLTLRAMPINDPQRMRKCLEWIWKQRDSYKTRPVALASLGVITAGNLV